jgi:hypothetical protein
MRNVFAFFLLVSSQNLYAQLPSAPRAIVSGDTEQQRRLQQDAFERWARDPDGPKKTARAKQSVAVQEFYSKARHFVDLWQAFASELNDKKTVNIKLAKQISKAFHELEKSDGWPVVAAK